MPLDPFGGAFLIMAVPRGIGKRDGVGRSKARKIHDHFRWRRGDLVWDRGQCCRSRRKVVGEL